MVDFGYPPMLSRFVEKIATASECSLFTSSRNGCLDEQSG